MNNRINSDDTADINKLWVNISDLVNTGDLLYE